jgi:hypothetical protein
MEPFIIRQVWQSDQILELNPGDSGASIQANTAFFACSLTAGSVYIITHFILIQCSLPSHPFSPDLPFLT